MRLREKYEQETGNEHTQKLPLGYYGKQYVFSVGYVEGLEKQLSKAPDRKYFCTTCDTFMAVDDSNGDICCVKCSLVIASYEPWAKDTETQEEGM